jgi:hypothetical protein
MDSNSLATVFALLRIFAYYLDMEISEDEKALGRKPQGSK